MSNIDKLLREIDVINKKYDTIAQATGANFNVFDALNASLETDISRILYTFLDPSGSHGQGTVFLESFFDIALSDIKIDKLELAQAKVYREYTINNGRRIDIYIETTNWAIPIEVKVFAIDQPSQCYDYLNFASQQKKNHLIYYLTPNGREPTKESINKNGETIMLDCLKLISFDHDVLKWLEICTAQHALKLPPIREVLVQFMTIVRRFSNILEDNIMKDISKVITASSANMQSAQAISDSLPECKRQIIKELFNAIEKKVIKQKLNNKYDWNFSGKEALCNASNYPKKGTNPCCPGISYHFKDFSVAGKNISVWIRCEIDWLLYIGFCVTIDGIKNNNKSEIISIKDLIRNGIQTKEEVEHENFKEEWAKTDWWLYWEYVYNQNGEEIDFYNANESAYYSLFDNEGFEYIVTQCSNKINTYLSRKTKIDD